MKRTVVLASTLVATLLAALPAGADKATREANARYEKGLSLYEAKDYEKAIAELKGAYQLDAKQEYLFAWAQAERLSGDCRSALGLYDQLLEDKRTPRELAERVREVHKRCEETLAADAPMPDPGPSAGGAAPTSPADATAPSTVDAAEDTAGEPRAWWKDPLGGAL